jgi:enoyl-CoA hydratase/carnithine racemase
MPSVDDPVLFELRPDGVALITFNRPASMNGWTNAMGTAYFRLLGQCAEDPAVRVIVVTGAGRAWCAGADMQSLSTLSSGGGTGDSDSDAAALQDEVGMDNHHWFTTTVPKPVIAAINGACAGMGFSQAMMCDIRFAASGAKITTSFSQRGLIAEWGVAWTLPRIVGMARAADLLFSGRVVLAEEAAVMGLVNGVFAAETFLEQVLAYASTLASTASPASWAVIKRQLYSDVHRTLPQAEAIGVELMLESFNRPDFKEGVASFLEKRPPLFRGYPPPVP